MQKRAHILYVWLQRASLEVIGKIKWYGTFLVQENITLIAHLPPLLVEQAAWNDLLELQLFRRGFMFTFGGFMHQVIWEDNFQKPFLTLKSIILVMHHFLNRVAQGKEQTQYYKIKVKIPYRPTLGHIKQASPSHGPQTSIDLQPVRNRATPQELSIRPATEASSVLAATPQHYYHQL